MRFAVPFLTTLLAISGVRSATVPTAEIDLANELLEARTMFNGQLLTYLDHHNDDRKNVLVSTYGLHSVLSSLLVGTEERTYKELFDALGYKYTKLSRETLLEAYEQTFLNLTQLSDYGLTFSNLLIVDKQLTLKEEYNKEVGKSFGAGLLKEDFKNEPEKATKEINDWANTVTKGKIPKLFDQPLKPDTGAILANALHLKANWRNQFDDKLDFVSKFTLGDGTTKNVTYMTIPAHRLKGSQYKRFFGFEIVRIPFDDAGRLWFSIILPDSIDKHFDCCTSFTHLIQAAVNRDVDLTFPKFKITQTHDKLKDAMKSLGVSDLFDQDSADLSGIDGKKHNLYVSSIVHKTIIEVDETGVEGAAVTAVVMPGITSVIHKAPPQPVVVNSPFVFVISDKASNVDIFTGLVYDPEQ